MDFNMIICLYTKTLNNHRLGDENTWNVKIQVKRNDEFMFSTF